MLLNTSLGCNVILGLSSSSHQMRVWKTVQSCQGPRRTPHICHLRFKDLKKMLKSEFNVISSEKSRENVSKTLPRRESHHFLQLNKQMSNNFKTLLVSLFCQRCCWTRAGPGAPPPPARPCAN